MNTQQFGSQEPNTPSNNDRELGPQPRESAAPSEATAPTVPLTPMGSVPTAEQGPPAAQWHDPAAPQSKARPRTGPIVWGAIVLIICAYSALQLLSPGGFDATAFVIASTIGLGILLLVVGGAVVVRNTRHK